MPLQERCIYCSITSAREVYIRSLYCSIHFYKRSTFSREVSSSRPTPTIGAVPVSHQAVGLTLGSFLPVGLYKVSLQLGSILLNSLLIKRPWMEFIVLGLRNLPKLSIVQDFAQYKVAYEALILSLTLCLLGC